MLYVVATSTRTECESRFAIAAAMSQALPYLLLVDQDCLLDGLIHAPQPHVDSCNRLLIGQLLHCLCS